MEKVNKFGEDLRTVHVEIPADAYTALDDLARANRRSMAGQLTALLRAARSKPKIRLVKGRAGGGGG